MVIVSFVESASLELVKIKKNLVLLCGLKTKEILFHIKIGLEIFVELWEKNLCAIFIEMVENHD